MRGVAREARTVFTGLMAQTHVPPPLLCLWPSVYISLLERTEKETMCTVCSLGLDPLH